MPKKVTNNEATFSLLPDAKFPKFKDTVSVHFIGLGGAGSNIIEYLFQKGIKGKFTCISNPIRPHLPHEIQFINFVPPGESHLVNGKEIIRNSDMKQKIFIPKTVLDIFEKNELFILLSGLGGYTGTFMTEALTLQLKQKEKEFVTISALPFSFEDKNRNSIAQNTVNNLKHIPNFKYNNLENIKLKYADLTMKDAFEKVHEQLYVILKTMLNANQN